MGITIRKIGSVVSFSTPQEIVISHGDDSIQIGDGVDLVTVTDVGGGVKALDVKLAGAAGDASAANQTSGAQKTQVVDEAGNSLDTSLVGGAYALKVSVVESVEGVGPSVKADDAAFTPATDSVMVLGGFADETAPDSVDEGDVGAVRMTLDRLLKIQLAGVAGSVSVPVTDNGGSLTVDGTFWQATQPISAAALPLPTGAATETTLALLATEATLLAMSGKLPATLGQKTMANSMAVVLASDQSSIPVTGTFWQATQPVSVAAAVTVAQATAANLKCLIDINAGQTLGTVSTITNVVHVDDNSGSLTVDQATASNLNVQAVGNVASDAADSGNPVKIGGLAKSANATAVADGDRVDAVFDLGGRQVVTYSDRALVARGSSTTISNTTETTILSAGAAGVFHDLCWLMITNTSSTAVRVDIRDATSGTVQFCVAIAANGGAVIAPPVPINQSTAANNWTAQLSGAVTDIRIIAMAIKRI